MNTNTNNAFTSFLQPEPLSQTEFFLKQDELQKEYETRNGELLLLQIDYKKVERSGGPGPRAGSIIVDRTVVVLGVIDCSLSVHADRPFLLKLPCRGYSQWHQGVSWLSLDRSDVISKVQAPLLSALSFERKGDPFYSANIGNNAVAEYLDNHEKSSKVGNDNEILAVWATAKKLGVDLLTSSKAINNALEGRRFEAVHEYVRGKALLFADEPAGMGVLLDNGKRRAAEACVSDAHKKLLQLGLSEEAITFRAREYVLQKLGL